MDGEVEDYAIGSFNPITVFVDDDWVGLPSGVDPDGSGPAASLGLDAFTTVQKAVDIVRDSGHVIVASGFYAEHVHITRQVAIEGAGADRTTLDGGGVGIVVDIAATADVDLSGIRIQRGAGVDGAGVRNLGSLQITESAVTDNTSQRGAGVFNAGTLLLSSSGIWDNWASGAGGGIYNAGTLNITNTTISGNTANGGSGGGLSSAGDTSLLNVTISDNRARFGGGVARLTGEFRLHNTIVAANVLLGLQLP